MKRILLQLLLFIYAASILKPAMPLLSDAFAHTFYYAQHVKTTHKEHGKYHVHYELVKQAQKGGSGENGYLKKSSLPDEHLIIKTFYCFIYPAPPNNNQQLTMQAVTDVCKTVLIAPPRC